MAIAKPILVEADIWATHASPANKQEPPQSKKDTGWMYGEKPPHNEFNWWWNIVGMMLVHLNQNGILAWDSNTDYNQGALVWNGNQLWQAQQPNSNEAPIASNPAYWKLFEGHQLDPRVDEIIDALNDLQNAIGGEDVLVVEQWDIGNSFLHLRQKHIPTPTIPPHS